LNHINTGGGDQIGFESQKIASPCCGSCKLNENCRILYNKIYPNYKNNGLTFIYKELKKCFCNLKAYVPVNTKKIAVFLNLELKTKNVKESEDQKNFREFVTEAGCISIILMEE